MGSSKIGNVVGSNNHKSRMMPDVRSGKSSDNGKGRGRNRSRGSERRTICSFIDYLSLEAREGDDKMIDSLIGYINEGIDNRKGGR